MVTVKLNALPDVAVAEAALVMARPLFTVRTKLCVAVPAELLAVIVSVYVPWLPAAGVPARVAVPSPLSVNVTPDGSAGLPDSRQRRRRVAGGGHCERARRARGERRRRWRW